MTFNPTAAAHLRRASAFFDEGQYENAITEYDAAIRLVPGHPTAWNDRGASHYRLKRYDKAVADYRESVRLRPRNGLAWINLGQTLVELGRHHDAWAAFESAIANDPDRQIQACTELAACAAKIGRPVPIPRIEEIKKTVAAAREAEKAGDWKTAISHYDRAIGIDGRFASILVDRGLAYRALEDTASALADFDRAITLRPDYSTALLERGRLHSAAGNLAGALENADTAARLDEFSYVAWNNRASALNRMNRHTEALGDCERSLAINSDYAYAWLNRGIALTGLKRHEEALADYRRAASLDSSIYKAWRDDIVNAQLEVAKQPRRRPRPAGDPALAAAMKSYDEGMACAGRNENSQALALFTDAIAKVDDVPAFHFQRGFVRPTTQEATADYLQAAELWPGFAMAWSNLAWASLEAKLYDAALSYAERGLSIDPDSPFLNVFAGRARAGKSDFKAAATHFDKAIRFYPDVPGVFWSRGVTRWELSDWRGAAEDFAEVARRDPSMKADAEKWIAEAEAKLAGAPAPAPAPAKPVSGRAADRLEDTAPREPGRVPNHAGEDQPDNRDYFVPPPQQIGPLLTAWSTLAVGDKPPTTGKRLLIAFSAMAVLGGIGAGIDWLAGVKDEFWFYAWPFGLGGLGLIGGWIGSRFEHWATFVGTEGIARIGCVHSRDNVTSRQILRFAEATELRTSATRHYRNGVYEGTSWTYTWTDRNGGVRLALSGRYHNEKALPAGSDDYRFAMSGEQAWSIFLFTRAEEALARDGYIEFPIGKRDYVRLGQGWIELRVGGKSDRRDAREIAMVSLAGGEFTIKTTDAKVGFFSSKGVFSFQYGTMANVTLFMIALDKLCGINVQ